MARYLRSGPFLGQTRNYNSDLPSELNELDQVTAEIQIVGPEVVVCVHTEDGVEELVREGQGVGFGVDGKYFVFKPSLADSLPVFAGRDPQVGCPDLQIKLLRQNIELMALPQPMSKTRIPGLRSTTWVSDSVSQRTFGPIAFSIIQSGSYFADRGKSGHANTIQNHKQVTVLVMPLMGRTLWRKISVRSSGVAASNSRTMS